MEGGAISPQNKLERLENSLNLVYLEIAKTWQIIRYNLPRIHENRCSQIKNYNKKMIAWLGTAPYLSFFFVTIFVYIYTRFLS